MTFEGEGLNLFVRFRNGAGRSVHYVSADDSRSFGGGSQGKKFRHLRTAPAQKDKPQRAESERGARASVHR